VSSPAPALITARTLAGASVADIRDTLDGIIEIAEWTGVAARDLPSFQAATESAHFHCASVLAPALIKIGAVGDATEIIIRAWPDDVQAASSWQPLTRLLEAAFAVAGQAPARYTQLDRRLETERQDGLRAEVERLTRRLVDADAVSERLARDHVAATAEVERLTAERDAAEAQVDEKAAEAD